ncbi:MAG: hypothetical protein GXP25_01870 [Planctomycetes bacterium]|nr:hypothetical protein [Planctomycetota bacterium]
MSAVYDYLNARIRGMKGRLFERDVYAKLLAAGEVQDVINFLLKSPYEVCMSSALTRFADARAVEQAVSEHLYNSLHKILDLAEGRPRHLISILLKRWDAYNVKSVLRGIHFGADPAETEAVFIPAGELHGETLHELAEAPDVRTALNLMATWHIDFAPPLNRAFADYEEAGNLSPLEYAIDRFYFEQSMADLMEGDENTALVREMLRMEADIINIVLALKFVNAADQKERVQSMLIAGSTLLPHFLHDLLHSENAAGALSRLAETIYAPAIEKGVLHYSETGRISILERQLEEVLVRRGIKMGLSDPLSIGVAIGYIWRKYNEFVNLRLIARCKSYGMPQGAIREELIIV